MSIKNKKGFTLIELLAVIVVLSIIILIATTNITKATIKARKGVLAVEGNELVDAAETVYQWEALEGNVTSGTVCISLQYLYDSSMYSKGKDDGYTGSVLIEPTGDDQVTYKIWISNGSYFVNGKDDGITATDVEQQTKSSNVANLETCGTTQSTDRTYLNSSSAKK